MRPNPFFKITFTGPTDAWPQKKETLINDIVEMVNDSAEDIFVREFFEDMDYEKGLILECSEKVAQILEKYPEVATVDKFKNTTDMNLVRVQEIQSKEREITEFFSKPQLRWAKGDKPPRP